METISGRKPKIIHEPGEVYRSKRNQYMTSHQLADFRRSPLLYKQKSSGLIPETTGAAYSIGAAAHCLTLEGRKAFESQYIVGGPINEKTGRCYGEDTKAFKTWADEQTRIVISDDAYALVCHLNSSVHSHELAKTLLSSGEPEGVIRATYYGVECQIRMDWLSAEWLADLKTCESLDRFAADCESYHYADQMAFYRAVLNVSIGLSEYEDSLPIYLIGVEKTPPYRCGVWLINPKKLLTATLLNSEALRELSVCRQSNSWPTRYESLLMLN